MTDPKIEQEIIIENGTETQNTTINQPSTQAKALLDNALVSIMNFIIKPWHKILSSLTFSNKFMVCVLLTFFASGYLPAIKIMGTSQTLYELADFSTFRVMLLITVALYALGVKRIVSKVASLILMLTVIYQLNELWEMISSFTGGSSSSIKSAIRMVLEVARYGLSLWVLSFILLIIMSLLPLYKQNKKLWPAIIDIMSTESSGNVDIQKMTSSVGAGFKSVVKKGQESIDHVGAKVGDEKVNKIKAATDNNNIRMAGGAVVAIIVLFMLFSGNSAPTNSDVEDVFSEGVDLGLFQGELSDIDIEDCDELADRKRPTFVCIVTGVITVDMSGLQSLFGTRSQNSKGSKRAKTQESFREEYVFVEGKNGWYSE